MKRDLLIVTAAVSAGAHAALVPEHMRESGWTGGGFIAATVLLAGPVVWLTYRPGDLAHAATALVFAGLLVGYVLAITTGVPVLQPEPEPVETVALLTKAVEAVGLFLALDLMRLRIPFFLKPTEGARA